MNRSPSDRVPQVGHHQTAGFRTPAQPSKWLAVVPSALILLLAWIGCENSDIPKLSTSVAKRPDTIVLISIDTLRADHLGVYGYDQNTSPAIDVIAKKGTVFTHANTTAPWTLPAHASMLTGLYPAQANVRRVGDKLAPSVPTLATKLGGAGFDTAGIVTGVWFPAGNLGRGHDRWRLLDAIPDELEEQSPEGRASEIVDFGLRQLENSKAQKRPLFLFMHFFDVHSDYVSKPEFEKLFVKQDLRKTTRVTGKTQQLAAISERKIVLTESERQDLVGLYDAGIRQLDTELNRLFDWIESNLAWKNTLVVITSDHGEALFDRAKQPVMHGATQYSEVTRIPLIVVGGVFQDGGEIIQPTSLVDVAPTIFAAADIPIDPALPGENLANFFSKEVNRPPIRPLYMQSAPAVNRDRIWAIRRGGDKLILNRDTGQRELYDLALDPGETKNLEVKRARIADELESLLEEFIEEFPDPLQESDHELDPTVREALKALGYSEQE